MNQKWRVYCCLIASALLIGCSKDKKTQESMDSSEDNIVNVSIDLSVDNPLYISVDSGFYDEEFDLVLEAYHDMDIYYTLDGSTPSNSSYKYSGPIHISDATNNPNVYSMRMDLSPECVQDSNEILEGDFTRTYAPDYNIDKCTVLRIAVYDDAGKEVVSECKTYFVGYGMREEYDNIGIVSLVTDPDNLFDYESGIYVFGKKGDELNANVDKELLDKNWKWTVGNYSMDGKEWEREAVIDYYDVNRNHMLSSKCGIRIQGNTSNAHTQKSFNVYSRKEYSGSRIFDVDIWGNGYKPHKFMIFAGGGDLFTKSKDYFISEVTKSFDFTTVDYVPCMLFLNGEYWGMYYLAEKFDDDYIAYRYGIDRDNVIVVKKNELEEGKEEDLESYFWMKDFIKENNLSDKDVYNRLCEIIDVDNFIDYFATQIYIARRNDWPTSNFALWKTREIGENEYADGRWRFILFDVNSSCMDDSGLDVIIDTIKYSDMYVFLMANEEFKWKLIGKLCTLGNTILDKDSYANFYDQRLSGYQNGLLYSHKRYYGTQVDIYEVLSSYEQYNVFFKTRLDFVINDTNYMYTLQAEEVKLTVTTNDDQLGQVDIDRCPITFANEEWQGRYIEGSWLTINARPNDGCEMVGIKVNGEVICADSYTFIIEGNQYIEVLFK